MVEPNLPNCPQSSAHSQELAMNVLNRLWAVALIAVAPLSGCLAAAAAGAGTGI